MEKFDYNLIVDETERKAVNSFAKKINVWPVLGRNGIKASNNTAHDKFSIDLSADGHVEGIRASGLSQHWFDFVSDLQFLKYVDFQNNGIYRLDPLANLKHLCWLGFAGNRISSLEPLRKLKTLQMLTFHTNQVEDLSPLEDLENLTHINFDDNLISWMGGISKLKKLKSLRFSGNRIEKLEPISGLVNLNNLVFKNNAITDIKCIARMKKLEYIDFGDNKIADISVLETLPNLKSVNFDNNKVEDLSPLAKLPGLEAVFFKMNPLIMPPMAVVERGLKHIRNYFQAKKESDGVSNCHEAKIVILGEGESGKTSLFNLLRGTDKPFDTQVTLGVNLCVQGVVDKHPQDAKESLTGYVWDFAGQEIQYNLHHCFLSPDALYLLVADNRGGRTRWDYWFMLFQSITQRAGNLEKTPVFVLMNKKVDVETHFDFEMTRYSQNPNFNEWMNIGFAEINLKDEYGSKHWESVKKRIWENLGALPVAKEFIPKSWAKLRNTLKAKAMQSPFISLDEFYALGKDDFSKRDLMRTALDYFHKIGLVLHYTNRTLANVVFLDLQWVVEKLYSVMRKSGTERNGRMSEQDLIDVWEGEQESDGSCAHLLNLLACPEFGICYRIGDTSDYVIPCMLPSRDASFEWDEKGSLVLRIDYPIMPADLIGRLIVRLSPWIEDHKLVWCDGVAISKQGAEAFITSTVSKETGGRCLRISIKGAEGSEDGMLWTIHGAVEAIHKEHYKDKISFIPFIACNCENCAKSESPFHIAMSALLALMRNGVHKTHCHHSAKLVDVGKLLGQVARTNDSEKNVTYCFDKVETFVGENHGAVNQLMPARERSAISGKD